MLLPPDAFLLRCETYLGPSVGLDMLAVEAGQHLPGGPVLRQHSWLLAGPGLHEAECPLDAADLVAAQALAVPDAPLWALPRHLPPPAPDLAPADWPFVTVQAHGRRHATGGPAAGRHYPAVAEVQAFLVELYGRYFLLRR